MHGGRISEMGHTFDRHTMCQLARNSSAFFFYLRVHSHRFALNIESSTKCLALSIHWKQIVRTVRNSRRMALGSRRQLALGNEFHCVHRLWHLFTTNTLWTLDTTKIWWNAVKQKRKAENKPNESRWSNGKRSISFYFSLLFSFRFLFHFDEDSNKNNTFGRLIETRSKNNQ